MAGRVESARHRRWADVVVIVVGVYAFLIALYGPGLAQPEGIATNVTSMAWFWGGTAIAGTLAIAAVFIALRNTVLARIMVALAGIALISVLFAFERVYIRPLVLFALPGLILLAATPYMGRMPTPEEEGQSRGEPRQQPPDQ